ncbi:MAG: hypothetical protein HKN80_05415 [Acidimicrobiia bacterium]|nr:hypothetical protein [Acidimicrobiia bacterium]
MDDPFELEIELRMVQEDLRELPAEAFNERITLRDRIIELEAAIAASTPVPVESLQSELVELEAKRIELVKTRMDPSNSNGGLGLAGGIDPNFLHKANRRIDELTGIKAVEARIREIERLLERKPPTTHRPPP